MSTPWSGLPGRLAERLAAGDFVVTAEMTPPDSADAQDVYARAAAFEDLVDAVNATDSPGANCHLSSVATCALLARRGIDAVAQISCRDRNRIAIQADVLGAAALGIHNLLCLTGDGVEAGDQPGAKPVFDLDGVTLLAAVRAMRDEGRFMSGRRIASPPRLLLGATDNPFNADMPLRVERLARKIEAGAGFIQTQYCFDVPQLGRYLELVCRRGLDRAAAILVGVGPLASAKAALWMRAHVPGVHIPDALVERLARAAEPQREGLAICVETMQAVRALPGVRGIHIMAFKQEQAIGELLERSGIGARRRSDRGQRTGT